MNLRSTPPDRRGCEAVAELLSWHANGTLDAVDRANVDAHAAICESCRKTLGVERRIVESMRAPRDNVEQSPHAGWQKMMERLDAEAGVEGAKDRADFDGTRAGSASSVAGLSRDTTPVRSFRKRVNWPAALGAAVAVQAAAIAVLAVALVRHRQSEVAPRFHTLSSADPTLAANAPLVRIAFDSSVDEAAARGVADAAAAHILAGPSPDNVYTFVFSDGTDTTQTLDRKVSGLRRQAHVLLVEPVIVGDTHTR